MSKEQKSPQIVIDPSRQVSGPSIGLFITGIIGAIFSGVAFISLIVGTGISMFWIDDIPGRYADFYQGTIGIGSSFIGILVAAFIIYAAIKMKELTQWGLAVVASILAMIPCISPCCIIGLPIGIWSLVVLMKPEVKAAFH